mmetsp:Transcript_103222/g.315851  ORF Transcript_103222/g.315851 Transcript_103222/m.315851 type:complete len:377 (+) Transcript_103222:381-1511(+)
MMIGYTPTMANITASCALGQSGKFLMMLSWTPRSEVVRTPKAKYPITAKAVSSTYKKAKAENMTCLNFCGEASSNSAYMGRTHIWMMMHWNSVAHIATEPRDSPKTQSGLTSTPPSFPTQNSLRSVGPTLSRSAKATVRMTKVNMVTTNVIAEVKASLLVSRKHSGKTTAKAPDVIATRDSRCCWPSPMPNSLKPHSATTTKYPMRHKNMDTHTAALVVTCKAEAALPAGMSPMSAPMSYNLRAWPASTTMHKVQQFTTSTTATMTKAVVTLAPAAAQGKHRMPEPRPAVTMLTIIAVLDVPPWVEPSVEHSVEPAAEPGGGSIDSASGSPNQRTFSSGRSAEATNAAASASARAVAESSARVSDGHRARCHWKTP